MGTITVNVDDETERLFRDTVRKEKGTGKGQLGSAISEALRQWADEKRQKEIADELIALMRKGFDLGRITAHSRDELHDRNI